MLEKHNIELVVDVRSKPTSRWSQFRLKPLERRLAGLGIQYLHLGEELGGHPESDDFYENGRVVYERLATRTEFRRGISRVIDLSERNRLVLMCAEEKPEECHRHPLLASELLARGAQVLHIRRDGSVEDATDFVEQNSIQMPLLETVGEDFTWQSPKRIRPRDQA